MDRKFSNRENTKYTSILCGNHFYNVCTVPADESHEGYDEQRYYFGKCPNGACERFKDKIKEKDMVTQSIKRKGKTFGSFLGHV